MPRTGKIIETAIESRLVVARGRKRRKLGVIAVINNVVSFWGDGNVLILDSVDVCKTLNVPNAIVYTLKRLK